MSHKHLHWRPSPAAKPSHLSSPTASSPQSLAALQGAASAFASRPTTTPTTVKQLRSQYEIGSNATRAERRRGRSPGVDNDSGTPANSTPYRSPSRGRHLSPEDAHLAGARSAVSSSSPPTPALVDQSTSTIAARIASTSPSPIRSSGSASPSKISDQQESRNTSASRPATATTRARAVPTPRTSQNNVHLTESPATMVNVDFENLPRLLPTSPVAIPERQTQTAQSLDDGPKQLQRKPVVPAPRMARTLSERAVPSSESGRASPAPLAHPRPIRAKPPAPLPRNRGDMARSPLQQSPLTATQLQGLTREEAINRMADAMVASSLASARTPSPGKKSRSHHSSRRRSASAHHAYQKPVIEDIKLPSQPKTQRAMKQTLRKTSPDNEDDGVEVTKRGRRHLMRKHPNMHQEGDRKRWRDKVTEAERKRYEGVFAANRGLLLRPVGRNASPSRLVDPNSEGNQVVNVIVRDIWDRSRLPVSILEQIYDLVAPEEPMYLNREQFVVGLWLIDQKLKGRKLPVKVSESVWASVRHSQGIRVSSKAMQ